MVPTGVIHGRFQVLHHDHLRYLLAGKARCRHLLVGITNPDPGLTADEAADPKRSARDANPLTYFERYQLVRAVLEEAGLQPAEFSVVPLPINFPQLYRYYVPLDATFFLTIYDDWGRGKRERFLALGLTIEVLWEKTPETKGISGAQVRAAMIAGQPWRHLVPEAAYRLLTQWDIPHRLRRLAAAAP
ncbi:MAG: nicotinate-nucleotide adenylyltransferase [Syntrophobacteraceae bacterium CG2_30_61_12]|nr:MAG: nicotinate-nucleotide adenylyltransferase [Syntrophobacteraceae bacterium CG2_30_61_12]